MKDVWLEDGDLLVLKGDMLRGREKENNIEDLVYNYNRRKFVKNDLNEGHLVRERTIIDDNDKMVHLSKPNLFSFPGFQAISRTENTKSFKPSPKLSLIMEPTENTSPSPPQYDYTTSV